jgi:hypothetical protein
MALTNLTKGTVVGSEGGSATTNLVQGLAKAFLSYKGTSTNSIYDSLNVSSVSDDATGEYTPTFSSAFSAANDYALAGFAQGDSAGGGRNLSGMGTPTTTTRQIETNNTHQNADIDCSHVQISVHGDLA